MLGFVMCEQHRGALALAGEVRRAMPTWMRPGSLARKDIALTYNLQHKQVRNDKYGKVPETLQKRYFRFLTLSVGAKLIWAQS